MVAGLPNLATEAFAGTHTAGTANPTVEAEPVGNPNDGAVLDFLAELAKLFGDGGQALALLLEDEVSEPGAGEAGGDQAVTDAETPDVPAPVVTPAVDMTLSDAMPPGESRPSTAEPGASHLASDATTRPVTALPVGQPASAHALSEPQRTDPAPKRGETAQAGFLERKPLEAPPRTGRQPIVELSPKEAGPPRGAVQNPSQPAVERGVEAAEVQRQPRQSERIPVAFAARLTGNEMNRKGGQITTQAAPRVAHTAADTEATKDVSRQTAPPAEFSPKPVPDTRSPDKDIRQPIARTEAKPETETEGVRAVAGTTGGKESREADPQTLNAPGGVGRAMTVTPATVPSPATNSGSGSEPVREAAAAPRSQFYETQRVIEADETTRSSGSATRIDLKLGSRPSDGVNLQVVERGGKVHVAVRTPDAQLANSLQAGLPRLVTLMENRGVRAETWNPGEAASVGAASREVATSASDNGGDPGSDRDSRGGQHEQQQQGRRRQDQPAWMEEFERNLSEDVKEDTQWTQLLRR